MTITRATEIFTYICTTFPSTARQRLERLMQVNPAFRLAVFRFAASTEGMTEQ
jgi:hypothetical protein